VAEISSAAVAANRTFAAAAVSVKTGGEATGTTNGNVPDLYSAPVAVWPAHVLPADVAARCRCLRRQSEHPSAGRRKGAGNRAHAAGFLCSTR